MRRVGGLLAFTAASAVATATPAAAQQVNLDIPAQNAASGLLALSHQADVQILSARRDTRGKRTNAVRGTMSVPQALQRMLAGTGLQARQTSERTFTVVRAAAPVVARAPARSRTTDEPDPEQVIVVSGIRRSLRQALEAKRNSDRVEEALAAEDLGQLPEASIAESLARLPGVATNRDRGNGTQISIRGMGPDLVSTLLNGREIVAAEPSRNVRYEQYPSELLSGARVYKSPTASQAEGAVAGQINLNTLRPLDFTTRQAAVNARLFHSDIANDVVDTEPWGYIVSGSFVDQFAGDTLGLALGYSGRRQTVATMRTNIFRYTSSGQDLNGDGQVDNVPYGFEALERGGADKRHGGMAALQWRPGSKFELNLDGFFSKVAFGETQRGVRVENLVAGNTFANAVLVDGFATSLDTASTAPTGQQIRGVNEHFFLRDSLWAGGANVSWRSGGWKATGDVGYSTTHRNQQFFTLRTEAFGVTPTSSFVSGSGHPAKMRFDVDLTDPGIFRIADLQIPENGGGAPLINDRLWTGRFDFRREVGKGVIKDVRAGVRWTSRHKDYTQRTQWEVLDPADRTPIPADLLRPPYRFGGEFSALPPIMAIDLDTAVSRYFGALDPQESFFDQRSSWKVTERTRAAFVQVDLEGSLGAIPFTGNFGVRAVTTSTLSRGKRIELTEHPDSSVTRETVPVAISNRFTDWLPTVNLTLKPNRQLQFRLGASKAISRPPLDNLNAGFGLFTFGEAVAYGGNPRLEPFRSKNLDVSIEWYFDPDNALTIAGFYKKLDSYIVTELSPLTLPGPPGEPDVSGWFRRPENGEGGWIRGVELTFQKAFTSLPAPLDGLGAYLSYSFTDSNIAVPESDNAIGKIALPGLSRHVASGTVYYSKRGFEARIGLRHRSDYATELGDTDRILYVAPETVIDFQTSYEFQKSSRLHGVKLVFQASNLTNEPFETYYGDRRLQGRFETFGRRFLLGAGFNF